jgi:enediyne biosynthesis thioesterase
MEVYEYHHTVGFEETNLVGNVYYANYVLWQGRCREMFLLEHAPSVIDELSRGLALVTTRVSCDYLREALAFDRLVIEMRLADLTQNRVTMRFDYQRLQGRERVLLARGEQQIASMRREGERMVPTPLPPSIREAFTRLAIRVQPVGSGR